MPLFGLQEVRNVARKAIWIQFKRAFLFLYNSIFTWFLIKISIIYSDLYDGGQSLNWVKQKVYDWSIVLPSSTCAYQKNFNRLTQLKQNGIKTTAIFSMFEPITTQFCSLEYSPLTLWLVERWKILMPLLFRFLTLIEFCFSY